MGSVVATRTIALSSAPSAVWPLITDTDRSNRLVMGAGNVYRPIEAGAKSSARFVVETRAAGFSMSYEEAPFEWTLNKRFSVYRKMRSGPLRSYTYGITLDPAPDGGTKLAIRLELEPRHWLLRPIAQIQGDRIVRGMCDLALSIDAHLRDSAPSPYEKPTSPANEERLAFASRELGARKLDAKTIQTLIELIRTGPDADLVRIRPFELAHDRGLDGREMLRTLLHAVTLGIVELRWALVCPSCRTANDQVSSLAEIGEDSHCQLCDLSYGIELDRAVEATFVPHPGVREVKDQMFCIGGPWRTPHVIVQAVVEPKQARALEAPAEPGRYRLFARGGALASVDVAPDAPAAASATLSGDQFTPKELRLAPGSELTVENATNDPLHVKIERLGYASLAATAHLVTTMSEFRRFFSKDLLKPSTPLKVASCAILFSDLTGSTALYTKAGDAAAFRLVDDHFDVLRKVIDEHGGAVVKTMGDAIMAAFIEPLGGVRAAIACLYAFEKFRVDAANGELTGIKLGLYAGPCYVVTANDAIDYFGQTVNCASRVQHCAETGEILFEEDVWARLPADDRAKLRLIERVETRVKGVSEVLQLVRTKLATEVVSERTLQHGERSGARPLLIPERS
jgi:adenylate cyclase